MKKNQINKVKLYRSPHFSRKVIKKANQNYSEYLSKNKKNLGVNNSGMNLKKLKKLNKIKNIVKDCSRNKDINKRILNNVISSQAKPKNRSLKQKKSCDTKRSTLKEDLAKACQITMLRNMSPPVNRKMLYELRAMKNNQGKWK